MKNVEDSKLYAAKTIYCENEDYLNDGLKEVSFLRGNRHPCIIDVTDVFITTHPRVLYIIMTYCETASIAKLIENAKKTNTTLAISVEFITKGTLPDPQ